MSGDDPLLAPIPGATHQEFGGAEIDTVVAGAARVKRLVYPAGTRWSQHMKALGTSEQCNHAHVGFLARGQIEGEYADGCRFAFRAPQAVVIEPGHDAWVVGDDDAVLIQFDFERDTTARLGLPDRHRH